MSRRTRTAKQASPIPATSDTTRPGPREIPGAMKAGTAPSSESSAPSVDPSGSDLPLNNVDVSSRAYAIWVGRGRPEGTDREDWFEAERQVRNERGGMHAPTHAVIAEQAREADEIQQAHEAGPSNRDRMVAIGRGNQQAGRQGS